MVHTMFYKCLSCSDGGEMVKWDVKLDDGQRRVATEMPETTEQ